MFSKLISLVKIKLKNSLDSLSERVPSLHIIFLILKPGTTIKFVALAILLYYLQLSKRSPLELLVLWLNNYSKLCYFFLHLVGI